MILVPDQKNSTGGAHAPLVASPSHNALRWFIGLRLVVVSTLFLGMLLIQVNTQVILQLKYFYSLVLFTYGISLVYILMYVRNLPTRLQTVSQLIGDIGIVTAVVYFTGGMYSPFSFLYLTVIVAAAVLLRGGGLIFAGLSAVSYGVLVDLMVLRVLAIPPNLAGASAPPAISRVLFQIMIHVAGFLLVAVLVSYLAESLRTARSRLEEETERAKRFVALTDHVVRSVSAGIVATDPDGRVLHINPAGARILGVDDADAVTGRPYDEVMDLEEQAWPFLAARARARGSVRVEGRLRGTGTRLGLTVGQLEDERGAFVGFIINFQDLTVAEVEAERQLLQERMAAVGEMAARMAHEIKNPLASISGSAQVLATAATTDETGGRLLAIIVDESRRLSAILDGFLAYVRPRGQSKTSCNLAAILRDCTALLERSHELTADHRLVVDIPDELRVVGEEGLLRQVVWNLSRNALQAMPDGGVLRIEAGRGTDSVILRWIDTGVGMPEELRTRAMEPFVTTRPGGTGLGLAVVYAAVEEHGGTIDIQSSPGRGTSVIVELPEGLVST